MQEQSLDGRLLLSLTCGGARKLEENKKIVNELNVFPIPDGDTGDNMYMTISSGCSNAAASSEEATLGEVADALAKGMLLGARGNSGVILSRMAAGFARGFSGLDKASAGDLQHAAECAVEEAYAAVSHPVEGTMLTVLKDPVRKASGSLTDGIERWLSELCEEMEAALERTPDQLDVLKEAGVVDSGGAGLFYIASGILQSLREGASDTSLKEPESQSKSQPAPDLDLFTSDSELEFGYCTEFLLRLQSSKVDLGSFDEKFLFDWLNANGESVVAFRDGSIIKVHVHTRTPGDILNHCQKYGEYLTLKIENMTLQHHGTTVANNYAPRLKDRRHLAVVAVAAGDGFAGALREAGADFVIEGGQTMNPSAQDFIDAFDKVDAENIFVFPNNSNIIMTANQAAGLYDKSKVYVVESRSMGAGYVAVASLDRSITEMDALASEASATAAAVVTGTVSRAIRDTHNNGLDIKQDDFIGFTGGDILCAEKNFADAALSLADKLDAGSSDVVIVFTGASVDAEEASDLSVALQKKYPRTEFIFNDGGQPVYDLIFILC
jgi:DAK2 domain fusion protein YloV